MTDHLNLYINQWGEKQSELLTEDMANIIQYAKAVGIDRVEILPSPEGKTWDGRQLYTLFGYSRMSDGVTCETELDTGVIEYIKPLADAITN